MKPIKELKQVKTDLADTFLALRKTALGEIGIVAFSKKDKRSVGAIYVANEFEAVKLAKAILDYCKTTIKKRDFGGNKV